MREHGRGASGRRRVECCDVRPGHVGGRSGKRCSTGRGVPRAVRQDVSTSHVVLRRSLLRSLTLMGGCARHHHPRLIRPPDGSQESLCLVLPLSARTIALRSQHRLNQGRSSGLCDLVVPSGRPRRMMTGGCHLTIGRVIALVDLIYVSVMHSVCLQASPM